MKYFTTLIQGNYSFSALIFRDYLLFSQLIAICVFIPLCKALFIPDVIIYLITCTYRLLILYALWQHTLQLHKWYKYLIIFALLPLSCAEILIFSSLLSHMMRIPYTLWNSVAISSIIQK